MQRYPDNTTANIEDFRRLNWKAAIDASARDGTGFVAGHLPKPSRRRGERFSAGKVLWLLADACSMMVNPNSVNTPFKPFMVTSTRDRQSQRFQETDVNLCPIEEVDDPWIQGRLADLVWLLKKPRIRSMRWQQSTPIAKSL
jgi:hypothetical protein